MKFISIIALVQILFFSVMMAQGQRVGIIKGFVFDVESKEPLVGANVSVKDTQTGAATDIAGEFVINNVPVGNYSLIFSYIGYETVTKTDIIVRSQRISFVDAELRLSSIGMEGVVVHSGYFPEAKDQPTSSVSFSREEIRRAPGSAGDVSRIIYGLPAVAKVNDTKNSLIVRGGGPTENGFYIDNIEIPNINHFPEQGSSGGPIGMINVDFIRDVDFHTGGFSAVYGDRLSSIMDISFRNGNPDELDTQLDMSFAGFGAIAEGPLPSGSGSWFLSARRSFLDLIVKAIGENETSIPQYSDLQGKLFFDLSPKHKLSILDVFTVDEISLSGEDAIKNEENIYTDFRFFSNTIGANWMYLWSKKGYSETSIANTSSLYDFKGFETRTLSQTGEEKVIFDLNPFESEFKLRNVNHFRFNATNAIDFGVEAKYISADYNNFYGAYNDDLGNPTVEYRVDDNLRVTKFFTFLNYQWSPFAKLTVAPGVRLGHFTYNKNTNISPRLALSYSASRTFSINAASGIFHQYLPLPLLAQNAASKNLKDPVAYHFIIGFQKLLAEDTQFTLEFYTKEYDHFPLDPVQPQLFIIDQIVQTSVFYNNNPLVDEGKAYTRGVEMMIRKKLARDFYGLLSASYFRSRYRDLNGEWRDRMFDNRFTFQAEGGYKPNNKWEFSIRWLFAGGRPYTPFDETASRNAARGVLDANNINGDRLPDYHSLNLRVDRRFHFSGSNLIFYLSIWNAYGRKNISNYIWNEITNRQEALEQWGSLPVFGLEFEF